MHHVLETVVSVLGWTTLVAIILAIGYGIDTLGGGIAGSLSALSEEAARERKERREYERLRAKFEPGAEAPASAAETRLRPRFRSRPSGLSSRLG